MLTQDDNSIQEYWLKKLQAGNANVKKGQNGDVCSFLKKSVNNTYLSKATSDEDISKFTIFLAIYSTLIRRYFSEVNHTIYSPNNLQYKDLKKEIPLIYTSDDSRDLDLRSYIEQIKINVKEVYNYAKGLEENLPETFTEEEFINSTPYSFIYQDENSGLKSNSNFCLKIAKIGQTSYEFFLTYSNKFVDNQVAKHFLNQFVEIVENLKSRIFESIDCFPFLSEAEKTKILNSFNETDKPFPANKTIIDLFEEQVMKHPLKAALEMNASSLSYEQIHFKSDQIAFYLKEQAKIDHNEVVGVLLPKDFESIIVILAIFKSGGTFLPIDIDYPDSRIEYIIKDSGLRTLISTRGSEMQYNSSNNICIEDISDYTGKFDELNVMIRPEDPAYMIYTSGSTGKPKGVKISHKSVINMSYDQINQFGISPNDRIIWFSAIAFDASISEILMSFLSGATMVIPDEKIKNDVEKFSLFLKETEPTVATFPPSFLNHLKDECLKSFRAIITAGEPPIVDKAFHIKSQGIRYFNAYGPTECSVCVSIHEIISNHQNNGFLPIGKPIANMRVYILDEKRNPVPVGVKGKIYVSGIGVASGYHERDALNQEKFIPNSFDESGVMYDTGDMGRWLPEGNIQFLGRLDDQIKLRGYRIELSEIETYILKFSSKISQALVEVKTINDSKHLVGYYTCNSAQDHKDIKEFLSKELPSYMLPSKFIRLDKFPVTVNGKIDKNALPDPSKFDQSVIRPTNNYQEELVKIWEQILGRENIGIEDNFFALGGYSLLVGQVINKIQKRLNKNISYRDFFENPTIKELSSNFLEYEFKPIPSTSLKSKYLVSDAQFRIWVLSQIEEGSQAYNMTGAIQLNGVLDIPRLEKSISKVIERHEILRTNFRFDAEEGELYQYINNIENVNFQFQKKDLSHGNKKDIDKYIDTELQKTFDLDTDLLLRGHLIYADLEKTILAFSMHHIIGDGWSMELLISELITNYNAFLKDSDFELPSLNVQFKDYSSWLRNQLNHEKFKKSEKYWLSQFQGELPSYNLPSFKRRPKVKSYKGNRLSRHYSADFSSKIKKFAKDHDATLFMILIAGVNTLIYRYTNQRDIILGTPVAGRNHTDLENSLGLFLNTLGIRTEIKDTYTFLDLLQIQRQILLDAYENQDYPFDSLIDKLQLNRDASRSALFDIMVVLQNQNGLNNSAYDTSFKDMTFEAYDTQKKFSQFDISFIFEESPSLKLTVEYNTDIYDEYLINQLFDHFENILDQFINQPYSQVNNFSYLSEEDTMLIEQELNALDDLNELESGISKSFESQVEKTPDAVALVFEGEELTYSELNKRSNQLARH
ncbi:amino acid adenylation domain-containing protein, partial [Salegentibacter sp. UBA1130]|uniref:amino acid adenylation domain-containing protein n=1 Tax=Salegentibacter sp. UBA1130 TaxID=1947451 RepID=UPI0025807BEF